MILKKTKFLLFLILLQEYTEFSCSLSLDDQLDNILKENLKKFGVSSHSADLNRNKRSNKPGIHFETKRRQEADLPICQNMKGILGKQNSIQNNIF